VAFGWSCSQHHQGFYAVLSAMLLGLVLGMAAYSQTNKKKRCVEIAETAQRAQPSEQKTFIFFIISSTYRLIFNIFHI
jgi:hypothetical protein